MTKRCTNNEEEMLSHYKAIGYRRHSGCLSRRSSIT